MSVDFNTLAKQFCEFYYQTFDTDRSQLGNLYRDHSMLTFTGTQLQGAQAIVEKLVNLPFGQVRHKIADIDAQPASAQGGDVIVLVTGELCVDGDNPLPYAQVFHLIPDGSSYYVFNDIFRLNA